MLSSLLSKYVDRKTDGTYAPGNNTCLFPNYLPPHPRETLISLSPLCQASLQWLLCIRFVSLGFLVFASILLVACLLLIFYFSPRVGQTNILVYIGICSLLGAFTISSVKGLGIAIRTVTSDPAVVRHPLTWILLVSLVSSIVVQVNYLNKSLDTFNTLLVYPIYYVCFTTVVLTTSIILFKEWGTMSGVDVVGTVGGFLVIILGVAMLHLFKDIHVTLEGLASRMCQPLEVKREDKHILVENMESLPPMREDAPRVFIIS